METLASSKKQSWLPWFLRGILVLGFLVLIGRLVDLQVIKGDYYRKLAEENRIKRITIVAPRGNIYARGGEVLVGNREIQKKILVGDDLENNEAEEISYLTEWEREYPLGAAFAHASGYVGKVNQEEWGKIKGKCPEKGPRTLNDYVGRTGLEEEYDCILTGINGEELIEVDAFGHEIRVLGRKDPVPGNDVHTHIDFGLQEFVASKLALLKGGVLITDTGGEILAFYSSPSYDPNILVSGQDPQQIKDILRDKELPLFNRLIGGQFHPGSIFKPLVAIAALQENKIDKDFSYTDTGQIAFKTLYGTYSFKNWFFTQYGGVEGNIGIKKALARSTDTFFYKVGEEAGVEVLEKWAKIFNLDSPTGIDIPGEISGLVPSPQWKLKVKEERWFLGDTYNLSIGQGDLALTPVAIHSALTSLANNSVFCSPHFMHLENEKAAKCKKLEIDGSNLNLILEGMESVCSTGGTAYPFFDFKEKTGIEVACKTGTAQNVNTDPHAWLFAFGPIDEKAEKKEIVATVLVENGGEGSKVAAPIAREIFDYWFINRN